MSDKVNFNLYNLSGNMLSFLREEELTEEQQNDILGVLGLTTEGLQGPQGEQGFPGFKYDIRRTTANNNNGYVIGEIVEYEGSYYICIANNDAIIPTNTDYWTPYSFVGPQGPQGQSSSELYKPYLYNKYLADNNISEIDGEAAWWYTGMGYGMIVGPQYTMTIGQAWEDKFLPDGITDIYFTQNFFNQFTSDFYGYDPLPYSTTYIGIDYDSTARGEVFINIINTINNCYNILNIPAPIVRTLDFTNLYDFYNTITANEEGFFNTTTQNLIESLLDDGWDIFWPNMGAVPIPWASLNIFPSYSIINGNYYCQYANNGNVYYTTVEPPVEESERNINDFTIIGTATQFPLRNLHNSIYFTYQDLGGGAEIYYYYD